MVIPGSFSCGTPSLLLRLIQYRLTAALLGAVSSVRESTPRLFACAHRCFLSDADPALLQRLLPPLFFFSYYEFSNPFLSLRVQDGFSAMSTKVLLDRLRLRLRCALPSFTEPFSIPLSTDFHPSRMDGCPNHRNNPPSRLEVSPFFCAFFLLFGLFQTSGGWVFSF